MLLAAGLVAIAAAMPATAQQVEVEEFTLDNGMQFLLVPRSDQPNVVSAGWVARVGSVNERPGITGISHFFEHMMFKGTDTIGTRNPERDAEYRAEQKRLRDAINELTWTEQYERFRRGEIDDPWDPANDTADLRRLRTRLAELIRTQQGRGAAEAIANLQRTLAAAEAGSAEATALAEQLAALQQKQAEAATIVKDEFDQVYTMAGGSGMNAFTSYDLTCYFITVPSNKL